jgi:Flp pilus assembly protein TadD
MKRSIFSLSALMSVMAVGQTSVDQDIQQLVEQVKQFRHANQADRVQLSLERLKRVAPEHLDTIAEEAFWAIHQGRLDDANRHLFRLKHAAPNHQLIEQISTLIRIEGIDKPKLVEAKLFYRGGQFEKSADILFGLFGDNPPSIDLSILYYNALAQTESTRYKAHNGFLKLIELYPLSDKAHLAFLGFKADESPVDANVLTELSLLAKNPTLLPEVMPVWVRALGNLPLLPENKAYFEDYLSYNKDDYYVGGFYKQVQEKEAFEAIYKDHPGYLAKLKGLKYLNRGRFNQSIRQLKIAQDSFPNDIEILNGLALAHLRNGQHGKAIKYFERLKTIAPAQESKWLSLQKTAQYWQYNKQIRSAISSNKLSYARRLLNKADILAESKQNSMRLQSLWLVAKNRKHEALSLYKDWLSENPNDKEVAVDAASLVYELQGYNGFERYVAMWPKARQIELSSEVDRIRGRYQFVQAHRAFKNHNWKLAIKHWLGAVKYDPTNEDYFRWVESALLQGDKAAHLPIYKTGVQVENEWLFGHLRLLDYWYQNGNFVAIEQHRVSLKPAIAKKLKSNFDFYKSKLLQDKAERNVINGNIAIARMQLRRAVELNASDPWLTLDLCRVLVDSGYTEDANRLFEKLLSDQRDDLDTVNAAALLMAYQENYLPAYQLIENSSAEIRSELKRPYYEYKYQWYIDSLSQLRDRSNYPINIDKVETDLIGAGYKNQLLDFYLDNSMRQKANQLVAKHTEKEIASNFSIWLAAIELATDSQDWSRIEKLFSLGREFASAEQPIGLAVRWYQILTRQSTLGSRFNEIHREYDVNSFAFSMFELNISTLNDRRASKVDSIRSVNRNPLFESYFSWFSQVSALTESQRRRSEYHLRQFIQSGVASEELTYGVVEHYLNSSEKSAIPSWLYQYIRNNPPIAEYRRVTWLQQVQVNSDEALARKYAKQWHLENPNHSGVRREYVRLYSKSSSQELIKLTQESIQHERFKLLQEFSLGLPVESVRETFRELGSTHKNEKAEIGRVEQKSLGTTLDSFAYDNWVVRSYQSDFIGQNRAEDERFAVGFSYINQSGSAGKSELKSLTVPMELRLPLEEDGFWFARLDPVYLNAGILDTSEQFSGQTFGGLLLCQPQCQNQLIEQQQSGLSVAFGFENEHWKADIGTTPLGFQVQDIIGGVEYLDDLFEGYWSLALEKRAVDSNLLSYAGTFAPYLQRTWGGVRSKGVDLGLGYDRGEFFGAWSSFGYHIYSGENTQDNQRTRAMGGVYFRILEEDPFRFNAGISLLTWQYERDLGEFSFGQGGYYSPQSYASVSVPLELYGRFERLSYKLRVTPAFSKTSDKDENFFPTSPVYQENAQAFSGLSGIVPIYEGSDSSGVSVSYAANLEYKINKHWNVGLNFGLQKAEFYQPANAMLYFKYYFNDNWLQVPTPPEPILKYTEF